METEPLTLTLAEAQQVINAQREEIRSLRQSICFIVNRIESSLSQIYSEVNDVVPRRFIENKEER